MSDQDLLERIKNVYRSIAHAAMKSGRSPEEVRLVAVSKNVSASLVKSAVEIGLREFGENRIQEAKEKILHLRSDISDAAVQWHFIGHLQKNKVKTAVELFDLIQSVDSVELARAINRQAEKEGKQQRILLQVKLSGELSKHGIMIDNLPYLIESVAGMKNLKAEGLMTMPPFSEDPEKSRPYFSQLREIRDRYQKAGVNLPELSIGMSNDFLIAVEEGATIVRIGTALFGERIREAT